MLYSEDYFIISFLFLFIVILLIFIVCTCYYGGVCYVGEDGKEEDSVDMEGVNIPLLWWAVTDTTATDTDTGTTVTTAAIAHASATSMKHLPPRQLSTLSMTHVV